MASDSARARELVLCYGWNATSYQLVNKGISHWFSWQKDAVVGFVRKNGVRVVAGAPVCHEARLPDVIAEWERDATSHGERVCYFGAAGRLHELLSAKRGYAIVTLGAQPVWNPQAWPDMMRDHASLRAQLSRARNKNVRVQEWNCELSGRDAQLRRVLREWLSTRGLPPLGFLVEPHTLDCWHLADRRIFVATRDERVVGFVNMAPIPCRQGWLTEQFVRGHAAPNGTIELLLDHAIRAVAASGAAYVTMGLVPLSLVTMGLVPLSLHGATPEQNPLWLRFLLDWVRAHGRRFYNFDGLDAFKSKFLPHDWEPIYAISNEAHFSPRALWAIAGAFSRRSPLFAVARGLGRAAQQEHLWLRERWTR